MDWKTKQKRALAKYQTELFAKEIRKLEDQQRKADENLEMRKQVWDAKYERREDIVEDYILGLIDKKEYKIQCWNWWNVYSDHHRGVKLEWLRMQYDFYSPRYERFLREKDDYWKRRRVERNRKHWRRQKEKGYYRRYRRKERARKMKEEGRRPRPKPRKRVKGWDTTQSKPSDTSCIKKEDTTQTKQ